MTQKSGVLHSIGTEESKVVFDLVAQLTGSVSDNPSRQEMILMNITRRMQAVGSPSLMNYLHYITLNEPELAQLISAVTIHTTSFFREMPHYRNLERELLRLNTRLSRRSYRLLSAACSTGEEAFSFAFILETFRHQFPGFDYQIQGVDVDPVSIKKASAANYRIADINLIPERYRLFLDPGASPGEYMINPEIRKRVKFEVGNLLDPNDLKQATYDQVVCRNVLIYLNDQKIDKIIMHLCSVLKPGGTLTLGHCETINGRAYNLVGLGNSSYRMPSDLDSPDINHERHLKVLVVDESPFIRLWLNNVATKNKMTFHSEKTAEGANAYLAQNSPDVILLDPKLPDQDGLSWLSVQRKSGVSVPCILFSDNSGTKADAMLEALSTIAQDYINKTMLGTDPKELLARMDSLILAHRQRGEADQRVPSTDDLMKKKSSLAGAQLPVVKPDIVLFGASTGGTDSLSQVLENMPAHSPPIVCVQHIPSEFARAFHERLVKKSQLRLGSLNAGDTELLPGHLYLPTQGAHVGLKLIGEKIFAYQSMMDKVCGHRPSVDFLFQSACHLRDKKILAALLTGMGKDGANGLLDLRLHGALTIAQDQASSVVWGMPGEANRLGAVQFLGNLRDLREVVLRAIGTSAAKKKIS